MLSFFCLLGGKVTFILAQRLVECFETPHGSSSYSVHRTHRGEQTWKYLGLPWESLRGVFLFFNSLILTQVLFIKKWTPSRLTAVSAVMQTGFLARRLASPPFLWECQSHNQLSCCVSQKEAFVRISGDLPVVSANGERRNQAPPCPHLLPTGGVGCQGSLLRPPQPTGRELGCCLAQSSCAEGVFLFGGKEIRLQRDVRQKVGINLQPHRCQARHLLPTLPPWRDTHQPLDSQFGS